MFNGFFSRAHAAQRGYPTCEVYAISDVHFDHKCNEERHNDS